MKSVHILLGCLFAIGISSVDAEAVSRGPTCLQEVEYLAHGKVELPDGSNFKNISEALRACNDNLLLDCRPGIIKDGTFTFDYLPPRNYIYCSATCVYTIELSCVEATSSPEEAFN